MLLAVMDCDMTPDLTPDCLLDKKSFTRPTVVEMHFYKTIIIVVVV